MLVRSVLLGCLALSACHSAELVGQSARSAAAADMTVGQSARSAAAADMTVGQSARSAAAADMTIGHATRAPDPRTLRAGPKESGAKPASGDADLAEAVRERLANHPAVTLDGMQISAVDGAVTLSGRADSDFEKEQAELATRRVHDVKRVNNELRIVAQPAAGRDDKALEAELAAAFASDPRIDPGLVGVHVEQDVVTLTGTLPDWDMIDAVLQRTFALQPRVVVNRLERAYRPQRHSEL